MDLKTEFSKNTNLQLSNSQILTLREDIIKFKEKNHRSKKWLHTNERESFILDYMKSRDLKTDYSVYEQAIYICMCMGWDMHPVVRERD